MEFRTASIRLFGHLNKACHGDCEDVFLEQVVGGLVPLLLHLRDPQASVASVSDHRVQGKGCWAQHALPEAWEGSGHSTPLYHRPASSPCACVSLTWSVLSWQLPSTNTFRRAGVYTLGNSSTLHASTW